MAWKPVLVKLPEEVIERIKSEDDYREAEGGIPNAGVAGWIRALVYDELDLGAVPSPYGERSEEWKQRNSAPVEEHIAGEAIAAARAKAGLSQSQLAKKAGANTSSVVNWEHRGVRSKRVVAKVREVLGDYL